jgi:catechol-2,3-dioxygenase
MLIVITLPLACCASVTFSTLSGAGKHTDSQGQVQILQGEQTMLGHLGVNVQHLAQAKAYYDDLMPLLDFEPYLSAADQFAYRPAGGKPGTYLFFYPALEEERYSRHRPGLQHLAFMVKSRAAVHMVHAKVQELGSSVIHPPQEFPQYHPGYYAMFWQDPEGFMLEVVCHRDQG